VREARDYRDALEEGEKNGKLKAVPALIRSGMTAEQAARALELPVGAVRKAAAQAQETARA
jgi:predicted transposase YdaD